MQNKTTACLPLDMEQINTDGLEIIKLDYHSSSLPEIVRKLKPLLYRENDSFCCILGPGSKEGIIGYGNTQEDAITDWTRQLNHWILNHGYGDSLAAFVVSRIA